MGIDNEFGECNKATMECSTYVFNNAKYLLNGPDWAGSANTSSELTSSATRLDSGNSDFGSENGKNPGVAAGMSNNLCVVGVLCGKPLEFA